MEDLIWELKNLDSLKEYIFDKLIGEHKNTKDINEDINEAINKYAERYHEIQLKSLGLHNVSKTKGTLCECDDEDDTIPLRWICTKCDKEWKP